jgi:hypothetical protein
MKFLRYAIFISLALVAVSSFAQEGQELTQAHKATIERMLKGLHAGEIAQIGMKQGFDALEASDPQSAAFAHQIMDGITPSQFLQKLVPVYAKFFSIDDAQAIARFFETPAGIKVSETMLQAFAVGKRPTFEHLSSADRLALGAFEQSHAGQMFGRSGTGIRAETGHMFQDLGQEIVVRKMKKAFAPVVKELDAHLSNDANDNFSAVDASSPVNNKADVFEQVAALALDATKQSQAIATRYQTELQQLGAETVLSPENLVSQAAITDGKRKIQLLNDDLDQFLQSSDDMRKKFFNKMDAISLPPRYKEAFMRGAERSQAAMFDENLRFSENQRTLAELYQRVLDFAEARLGRVTVRDNTLVFSETADLEIFRSLQAQIKVESQREKALNQESRERVKQLMQGMR